MSTAVAAAAERPKRIQRKRTRGWKMPPNAVYVGRPSAFGNPFSTAKAFRAWLAGVGKLRGVYQVRRLVILARLPQLRGKDLACWCPADCDCHADILRELANERPMHSPDMKGNR